MRKLWLGIAAVGLLGIVGAVAQDQGEPPAEPEPQHCFEVVTGKAAVSSNATYRSAGGVDYMMLVDRCQGRSWTLDRSHDGANDRAEEWVPMVFVGQ